MFTKSEESRVETDSSRKPVKFKYLIKVNCT